MRDNKPNRRFKKPRGMVKAAVGYPFAKGRIQDTAWYGMHIAQTGAFAYFAGRYLIKPSFDAGKGIDDTANSFYKIAKDLKGITENLIAKVNDLAVRAGIGFRESKSGIEETVFAIESDIKAELNGGMQATHSAAELEQQQALVAQYKAGVAGYEAVVQQNITHLVDMKHQLRNIRTQIAKPGNKVRENVGFLDKLLNFKESALSTAGANTKEQYEVNFSALEAAYNHVNQNQATAERALLVLREEYTRKIEAKGADRYALRQEYLTKSVAVLKNFRKAASLKEVIGNSAPDTDTKAEQTAFREQMSAVVQQSEGIRLEMRNMGYDIAASGGFFQYALPVAVAAGCLLVYVKFVGLEKKALGGLKKCLGGVKEILYKEVEKND